MQNMSCNQVNFLLMHMIMYPLVLFLRNASLDTLDIVESLSQNTHT